MKINKVDNVKFEAGNIYLERISQKNIPSYNAIKKIAEDKDIDIFISKHKESKYLPSEDMYLVTAIKEIPVVTRNFFQTHNDIKHSASCMITNKKTKTEELSVKIYNTTMDAIESLEKKIGIKK